MTRATLKIRTSKNLHDNIIQESYGKKISISEKKEPQFQLDLQSWPKSMTLCQKAAFWPALQML